MVSPLVTNAGHVCITDCNLYFQPLNGYPVSLHAFFGMFLQFLHWGPHVSVCLKGFSGADRATQRTTHLQTETRLEAFSE